MTDAGSLQVATPTDREVVITRMFNAPPELVFEAHTKPELVRQWLLGPPGWSMPVCEIDLRVGGRFRYVWHNEDGRDMGLGGVFREIVAPERIVHAELFDEDWTDGETLVTTTFTAQGAATAMKLTVLYSSKEAREGALFTGMTDGMEAGYQRLDSMLAEMKS